MSTLHLPPLKSLDPLLEQKEVAVATQVEAEAAVDEAGADAYGERLGETAVAAKEKVIEILGRPNRGTDKEQAAPTFSLRGKQYL